MGQALPPANTFLTHFRGTNPNRKSLTVETPLTVLLSLFLVPEKVRLLLFGPAGRPPGRSITWLIRIASVVVSMLVLILALPVWRQTGDCNEYPELRAERGTGVEDSDQHYGSETCGR